MNNLQVLLPILSAVVSSVGTYLISKNKTKQDMEQFFVSKMQEMFKEQQAEIRELKEEIKQLTEENYQLKLEIVALKDELQSHKSEER